jgi:uncharacterized ubiquitin-like protein YukD
MKFLKNVFIVLTALGAFLIVAGAAGSHGHFKFRPHMTEDWFIFGTPLIGIIGLVVVELRIRRLNSDTFKLRISDKEEFKKLIDLLDKAVTTLRKSNGDNEFLSYLKISTDNLKQLKFDEIQNIWTWFAPTGVWDDSVGETGTDLGNEIFELAENLRRQVR